VRRVFFLTRAGVRGCSARFLRRFGTASALSPAADRLLRPANERDGALF
jgi:hypothetical protein